MSGATDSTGENAQNTRREFVHNIRSTICTSFLVEKLYVQVNP